MIYSKYAHSHDTDGKHSFVELFSVLVIISQILSLIYMLKDEIQPIIGTSYRFAVLVGQSCKINSINQETILGVNVEF